jgi:hypothetical protein
MAEPLEQGRGPDTSVAERLFHGLRDSLLSLSHEAAKSEERNWENAERFFSLSKKVDQLRRELSINTADAPARTFADGDNKRRTHSPRQDVARRKSKKDYPKYAVRSDVLIKTGLSRDRRTEYEHAIPKNEFNAILTRLGELATRKHFVAEDVLGKMQCPSYQVYLVISLLKERELLAVPRRGLYSVRRPRQFAAESQSVWDSLTSV